MEQRMDGNRTTIHRVWKMAAVLMVLLLAGTTSKIEAQVKNVVLVHGAWADGSGWEGIFKILTEKGYHVSVVSNSNSSLAEDVKITRAVLAKQDGPVLLVGHSYGGAIITQAGDTSNVAGLVYISAFVPDQGESLLSMLQAGPPNPNSGILPPKDGLIWIDDAKFHENFCADLPASQAAFMAASQTPISTEAFAAPLTAAAWKTRKSWYVLSTQDRMIPPDAQRAMAKRANAGITEIKSSHVGYITHAAEAAAVIDKAAKTLH